MFPVCRSMNSYPFQITQMPSNQYYHHPSCDGSPSQQVKADPNGPPFMYEPWPHTSGYPLPMQYHDCCNPGQYPPYYNFRPPCPHYPSPPAYNHFYPPQPYPAYYVPPSHYTMQLPRYEYDKNFPRDFHCCGCPNHSYNVKEGNNVNIEEHEPEVEQRKSESLVPFKANNFPYPVMWVPPGYSMNNKQAKRAAENEVEREQVAPIIRRPQWRLRPVETEARKAHHQDTPLVKKPQSVQRVEQDPNGTYGWFPLDMNSIRELIEGGEGKKSRDVRNKEQDKQYSCPIIWIPYDGGQGNKNEDEKKDNHVRDKAQDQHQQPPYPIIWMPNDRQGEDQKKGEEQRDVGRKNEAEKMRTAEGDDHHTVGTRAATKTGNLKTIPVKQLEESVVPEPLKKDEEHKVNANGNDINVQSSSPSKKSKLPPICLRVDPPKKKNSHGGSRSPSPPSKKEMKVGEAEEKTPRGSKIEMSHSAEEGQKGSNNLKGEDADADAEKKVILEGRGVKSADAKTGDEERAQIGEPHGAKEDKPQEVSKSNSERKIFSETKAAVMIQSAYRGYEVRRLEPLRKLRQIAKVREEAVEVKKHIEDLESRGGLLSNMEKVSVGETIMKLLLKLDTIQGLHPSVREVRRCAAKELIALQEKLDSMSSQKSVPSVEETATDQTVGEPLKVSSSIHNDSSRETTETARESSKVSGYGEGSEDEDNSSKACGEDKVSDLKAQLSQPQTINDVCGSELTETLDTSSTFMESGSNVQDENLVTSASISTMPQTVEKETFRREADQREVSLQDRESPADFATKENITAHVDTASANKDGEVMLRSDSLQETIEDLEKEILQWESDGGAPTREESLEDEASRSVPELLEIDSALADLPQDVIEEDGNGHDVEVSTQETLNKDQETEQSSDEPELRNEKTLTIEPESCKPDEVDIPIMEQDEQELIHDEVSEVPADENEEAKRSITVFAEHPIKMNENVSIEFFNDQDKTPQENAFADEMHLSKDEDAASELTTESQDSVVECEEATDKKIVEENEKLRGMLQKLIASEKEHQDVISSLSEKLKDLEKQLSKKKVKPTKRPRVIVSCGKSLKRSLKQRPAGVVS